MTVENTVRSKPVEPKGVFKGDDDNRDNSGRMISVELADVVTEMKSMLDTDLVQKA